VYLDASANPGVMERQGVVTFTTRVAPVVTRTVLVTQPGQVPRLSVASRSVLNQPGASVSTHLAYVESNTDWVVTGPDWVQVSPTSGSGDGRVVLTVQPNPGGVERTGTVEFALSSPSLSVPARSVTIHQLAGGAVAGSVDWTLLAGPPPGLTSQAGNTEWFRLVPAVTGEWSVSVQTAGYFESAGYYLMVYEAGGTNPIAAVDGTRNTQFEVTAGLTAGRTYYVAVKPPMPDDRVIGTAVTAVPPGG